MRLAILITNTDFSDFAARHPHDGEKFAALIHARRPDWACAWFWAGKGELPEDRCGRMRPGCGRCRTCS